MYLLVQRRLQVQGSVRHQEAASRLHHRLRTRFFRSVLNLPDHQTHRVPAVIKHVMKIQQNTHVQDSDTQSLNFLLFGQP